MKESLRSLSVLSLGLVLFAQACAQDLQGADAALRKAAEARGKDPKELGAAGSVKKASEEFTAASKGMTASAAANGWLALFDRYAAARAEQPVSLDTVVYALPSPESWNLIATGLRKRTAGKTDLRSVGINLLAELLRGDVAAEWQAMAALMKQGSGPAAGMRGQFVTLYQQLARHTGDKKRLASSVTMALGTKTPGDRGSLDIPDLVTLVGATEAEKILLTALTTSTQPLDVKEGRATRALAQRLALTNAKRLKSPQWGLVDSQTPKLYEAMAARFGTKANPNEGNGLLERARIDYLFGLLREGRRAEALKLARNETGASYYLMQNSRESGLDDLMGTRDFTAFLGEAVAGKPESPFWDLYVVSAARSGESAAVVTRLQQEMANPKLTKKGRAALTQRLATALLSADRVDEGLALLKRQIAAPEEPSMGPYYAIMYARLGHLLNRPAVVEEGIAAAKKVGQSGDRFAYMESGLVDLLLDLGRNAEAERMAIDAYVKSASGPEARYAFMGSGNPSLVTLAQLYYRLNRPADVRTLLDRAPDWGVKDAIELAGARTFGSDAEVPMGFVAAWALAKTGSQAAAETILSRVLASYGGYDPAYALLYEIKGAEAIPRLDAIYAADQFEERPLIWKAIALKDAGRLEEAETTIRKAISVDPSDGETKGGNRMRAYSVLADIRAARGDEAGAKEYRGAVAAIRLAEHADQLAEVGLLKRAIDEYERSTELFSNAYCIQSRLAVDLMEQGRVKEAEEHYRRAYELMPSSFGRVETHCMGCEHVFEGEIAQNIAERVFGQLARKTPEKPQVHYLLGYLRFEQGRYPEAMALYRKAVALDPDYLNAWKQMSAVSDLIAVTPAEQTAISDAILRLDPLQKHGQHEPTGDLRRLWRRVDSALASLNVQGPSEAYPLAASTEAAAKRPAEFEGVMAGEMLNARLGGVRSAGGAVAMHPVVQTLLQIIEMGNMGSMNEE